MPANYDLPRASGVWNQQDIALYNQLPYYLANLTAATFPMWKTWEKLLGTQKWQSNMGPIMKGVRQEFSPIQAATFFPNDITSNPNKDVIEFRETTEQARVKRHLFQSQQFNFNPSFADFMKDQIGFGVRDLAQQIGQRTDAFIRSAIFYFSPYVFISGKGNVPTSTDPFAGDELVTAPLLIGNAAGTAAGSKNTGWLQAACAFIGSGGDVGSLSYKVIRKVKTILCEDLQAPAFEGMANLPKDNETIKGKWVLITSNEGFEALSFDNFILANRALAVNLINDEFSGVIGSHVACKIERFALRIAADGTIPGPQSWEANSAAYNYGQTVANPAYVNAPFEVAFMMGADPYRALQVGPSPREFAGGSMSGDKFASLNWNGEVRINSNMLINLGTTAAPILDTNKYGEFRELIADVALGIIPVNRRNCIPVLFRRRRVKTN